MGGKHFLIYLFVSSLSARAEPRDKAKDAVLAIVLGTSAVFATAMLVRQCRIKAKFIADDSVQNRRAFVRAGFEGTIPMTKATFDEGVLQIEKESFAFPWNRDDFMRNLHDKFCKHCFGRVVVVDGRIVGYVVYKLHDRKLEILNLAVDPAFRNAGIGTHLVGEMLRKLSPTRRRSVSLVVRESHPAAVKFFQSLGFTLDDVDKDTLMSYRLPETSEENYSGYRSIAVVADGSVETPGTIRTLSDPELDTLMNQLTQGDKDAR